MKHASFVAAAAIILLAKALALFHAARNRSGPTAAEISLTDRELSYYRDTDDSGVGLSLHWADFSSPIYALAAESGRFRKRALAGQDKAGGTGL